MRQIRNMELLVHRMLNDGRGLDSKGIVLS